MTLTFSFSLIVLLVCPNSNFSSNKARYMSSGEERTLEIRDGGVAFGYDHEEPLQKKKNLRIGFGQFSHWPQKERQKKSGVQRKSSNIGGTPGQAEPCGASDLHQSRGPTERFPGAVGVEKCIPSLVASYWCSMLNPHRTHTPILFLRFLSLHIILCCNSGNYLLFQSPLSTFHFSNTP